MMDSHNISLVLAYCIDHKVSYIPSYRHKMMRVTSDSCLGTSIDCVYKYLCCIFTHRCSEGLTCE